MGDGAGPIGTNLLGKRQKVFNQYCLNAKHSIFKVSQQLPPIVFFLFQAHRNFCVAIIKLFEAILDPILDFPKADYVDGSRSNSKMNPCPVLQKFFHPAIPDGRTWSKFGEHG